MIYCLVQNEPYLLTPLLWPSDPDVDIWSYHDLLQILPMVIDGHFVVALDIPLVNMHISNLVYKNYNIPILHPKL